jgi:hypothetical protein
MNPPHDHERRDATSAADGRGLLAALLADPSTWAEPSPGLEDAVVRAVQDAAGETKPSSASVTTRSRVRRSRRRPLLVAAMAAAVIAVVAVVLAVSGSGGAHTVYEAQLDPLARGAGAGATATMSKSDAGFRIALEAHGLPALPDGRYYAAWLKDRAGTVVPVGTFSSSNGTVTLWSGVSPTAFRTITVTVQPADHAEPTFGRRVLVGRLRRR